MMKISRGDFVKGLGAAGALTVFGVGYSDTLKGLSKGWWKGEKPADHISLNASEPEFRVDRATGEVRPNLKQYVANSVCVGCTSLCGVRVRVDKETGKVLRVTGNAYNPLGADPHLPYETPILESYKALSGYGDSGLKHRATACGRGNAVLDKLYDPYRVLMPLKRVGRRGEGRWEPISFEKLVEEVVEGGDLFGEGQVDGLRTIRDLKTPIDPNAPELGPKVNQMAFMSGFNEGRQALAKRFTIMAFGSTNFTGQGGNCGLTMRAGYGALLGDFNKIPHLKPDLRNTEFLLNIGTAPAQAGNPFKRQGQLVAEARTDGDLTYVTVDPVLTNSDSMAAGKRSRWVPVNPGTDGALAMAMIRWILENKRYNAAFLSQPNAKMAGAAGEPSWSNATHLVVVEPGDQDYGKFLKALKLELEGAEDKDYVVIDEASGEPVAHSRATGAASLFHDGMLTVNGRSIRVKSSLQLLLEESQKHTLQEYSRVCGIPEKTIVKLAEEFASHGRRAVADCHGGTMHSNGFYTAYATVMLNALVGNLNWKGGASPGGGRYSDVGDGPRYDMNKFPGKVKPKGVKISRQGFAYEDTSEFKRKKEAGENPYPSQAPWYPLSIGLQPEFIPSALNGYPYPLKALLLWATNPMYGQAGLYEHSREALADPKRIPLIVSIDPFINETSSFADYIVPDTVLYESWGAAPVWGGYLTKSNSVRWPVVDSPLAKTPDGDHVSMESFLISVAKRLDLPGFGDKAIPDAEGNLHPLHRPEDWHLRVAANIAFDGAPVPEAEDEELVLTGVERVNGVIDSTLKSEERRRVAYLLARGGRFEGTEKAYEGEWLGHRYGKPMQIYNEKLAISRSSTTGKSHSGIPVWMPPVFADGSEIENVYKATEWPFRTVSTKSQLISSGAINAPKLQRIQPENAVVLHEVDADRLGVKSGDAVRVISPGGSIEGIASVRWGIQRGVIGIEHGYGHWGLGGRKEQIENKVWHASGLRGAGVSNNRLGYPDPTREGISTLADYVIGANARQGIPVKVHKV